MRYSICGVLKKMQRDICYWLIILYCRIFLYINKTGSCKVAIWIKKWHWRILYNLYNLAAMSVRILLNALSSFTHKPSPAECIHAWAKKIYRNTHNDSEIALTLLPTWNWTMYLEIFWTCQHDGPLAPTPLICKCLVTLYECTL